MRKMYLWAVIVLLLVANMMSLHRIQKYEAYYQGAEELLDTLENHYNWIDAIDNETYYDGVANLHHN